MQFIGTPILGRLSDRFGRKPICFSASSAHWQALSCSVLQNGAMDLISLVYHSTDFPARTCPRRRRQLQTARTKELHTRLGIDRRGVRGWIYSGSIIVMRCSPLQAPESVDHPRVDPSCLPPRGDSGPRGGCPSVGGPDGAGLPGLAGLP